MRRLITQNHLRFMKHLRRTFKHACSGVSWKISYFSVLIPKENRYRFGIPATTVSLFLLPVLISILRYSPCALTIRQQFVSYVQFLIAWYIEHGTRLLENCPLTENPEGFFSFSFLLFSLFFFFRSSFSRKKRGKRTRNIFQCERKSEQYRVKRIGK